jgi:hypothetical protein
MVGYHADHPVPHCCSCYLPAAQVNSLTSFETDLPFDYYTMPFCTPPEGVKRASNSANLGTVLMGIRLENSPYNFSMMVGAAGRQPGGPRFQSGATGDRQQDACAEVSAEWNCSRQVCWCGSRSDSSMLSWAATTLQLLLATGMCRSTSGCVTTAPCS